MNTSYQLAMLWSDWIIWTLFVLVVLFFLHVRKQPHLSQPWKTVLKKKLGMIALVVLSVYIVIGMLDSIHLQVSPSQIKSALDLIVSPLGNQDEKSYSAPFATRLYTQDIVTLDNGKEVRAYPKLKFAGQHLQNPRRGETKDIVTRISIGAVLGLMSFLLISGVILLLLAKSNQQSYKNYWRQFIAGKTTIAWREGLITLGIIWILIFMIASVCTHYHILGTDKVGRDVFYQAIKSIRTGLLIGTLTTVFMLPFALILGTLAGYFRGFIDDGIQYLYTTLSSIPGVLLISAAVLMLQVYISNHEHYFPSLAKRADARLLALCFILGITSWANLCRLLRAETLKLRDLEFVQAAVSLGVGRLKIISRHIIPNVMHIVLITLVLDFSGLVLAEAVLSYVGVGVDPTTASWGNMINSSRLELAREPIVWWPLIAALIFMFVLVLTANIFSDAVRDAFDPRLRKEN